MRNRLILMAIFIGMININVRAAIKRPRRPSVTHSYRKFFDTFIKLEAPEGLCSGFTLKYKKPMAREQDKIYLKSTIVGDAGKTTVQSRYFGSDEGLSRTYVPLRSGGMKVKYKGIRASHYRIYCYKKTSKGLRHVDCKGYVTFSDVIPKDNCSVFCRTAPYLCKYRFSPLNLN